AHPQHTEHVVCGRLGQHGRGDVVDEHVGRGAPAQLGAVHQLKADLIFENRPPWPPSPTTSPRPAASCLSSSTSASVSLVGTSTRTIATRSPRPRPWSRVPPLPRSTNRCPGWVPAGIVSSSSPS